MHSTGLPLPAPRILALCDRGPLAAAAAARRLFERTPGDSPARPWAALTLGWCLMVREQMGEALDLLRQAAAGPG